MITVEDQISHEYYRITFQLNFFGKIQCVGQLDALQAPGSASHFLKLEHLIEDWLQRPAPMRGEEDLRIERRSCGDQKILAFSKFLRLRSSSGCEFCWPRVVTGGLNRRRLAVELWINKRDSNAVAAMRVFMRSFLFRVYLHNTRHEFKENDFRRVQNSRFLPVLENVDYDSVVRFTVENARESCGLYSWVGWVSTN